MSRWHKSSCYTPTVFVENGLPHCKSCESSPNIPKLASERAGHSPPWSVPPDEEFGEMNLSWPESVSYSPRTRETTMKEARVAEDLGPQHELPHIYNKRLENNEFRLLYLPAVDDERRPIHASLEAYQIDDCPEYETVSYCWGGENGDTTLCKPVFLGDYWDILLQTQNCWSMLHYLRPRVGVRVVWVDAICINQTDHQERESQVAIMGSIYQQCLRAVVYLGQDVVRSGSNGHRVYPVRRDLNTESASAVDLHQLLKMRYFQRVWVIQELVLAPMVVIPVNSMELTARRRTASRDEVPWHESDAPWMRYLCTERSDTSLRGILEETRNSQSTDPRDKVFGLLGFLFGSTGLRPNYLLSALHIYVGTIAYMLLNESHSHLLIEAAGYQAPPEAPSWLPDGKLSDLGGLLQILSNFRSRSKALGSTINNFPAVNFWVEVLKLNPDWEMLLLARSDGRENACHPPDQVFGSINPTTSALTLRLVYICQFSSRPYQIHRDAPLCRTFEITVSNCTLYICTSDHSLDITIEPGLTSVFLLKDKLNPPFLLFMRRSRSNGNYRLLKCCLCFGIFLSTKPPSESIFPTPDLRFDSPLFNSSTPFTRNIPFRSYYTRFFCYTVYDVVSEIRMMRDSSWEALQGMRTTIDPLNQNTVTSHIIGLFQKLYASPNTPFVDLYFDCLRQCSLDCRVEIEDRGEEAWVWVTMNPRDWFRAHQALNRRWYEKAFVDSVERSSARFISPWHWARLPGSPESADEDDLDADEDDLDVLETKYTSATHELSLWTCLRKPKLFEILAESTHQGPGFSYNYNEEHTIKRFTANSWIHARGVSMVAEMEDLREWLESSPYLKLFEKLRVCSRLIKEDELTLATTAPKPEYRLVGYYDWPDCFFDGEYIPGKQETITIF